MTSRAPRDDTPPEMIRVLHVDDEPNFADMVATFLERDDDRFSIDTATSATDGLELIADEEFDCIVSDYDMPGQNGIQFLEAVRERRPDLPFILYTGTGSEEVASDATSAGVTDYLQKESGTGQYTVLANRITNAVEQYRANREAETSQRRLSLFVEQSPLGVIEWNREFEVVRPNESARQILGYAEDELVGQSWGRIVPESKREDVPALLSRLRERDGGVRSIIENVTRDGGRIVCEWHNHVVTDDEGEVVAIFSQFQEVTDQHRRRRRRGRQRDALLELATDDAVVTGAFETAARRITETAADVLDVHRVNVWLFDGDGESLTCVDHYDRDEDDHDHGMALAVEENPAYVEALETHRTIDAVDARADPRTAGLDDYLDAHEIGSLLDGTLRSEGEVVGVVCHEHVGGTREWTDDEIQFVSQIADVVHRALRNRDRVEQRRESAFRRSLLEAQQEATIDGVLVADDDGEIVSYNDRFVEMWGLREELVKSGDGEAVLEWTMDKLADPEQFRENVEHLYDHSTKTSRDEIELADGRVFDRYSAPVVGDDGTYYGRLWTVRDITDREQYERTVAALHDTAEEILRAENCDQVSAVMVQAVEELLDIPINGVAMHDDARNALRTTVVTDRAEEVIDDEPTFHPGESLAWDVFETGETAQYDDVSTVRGRLNADTAIRSEILVPVGEHGIAWVSSTEVGAFDETDVSLVETLASHAEVALDRIERERALEASEARYRSLTDDVLDTSRVGTVILDDDFEVVWLNEAIEEYFGIDREAVLGADKRRLIEDRIKHICEDPETFAETVQATYDDNSYVEEFECHVLPDGDRDERWLTHWSQPITSGLYEGGRIEHYTDVTARKRRERELQRQNDRLEEFASVVSHDLRNPLTVAEGRLELAREECESDHHDAVANAHDRMHELVEDLLTLARKGDRVRESEPVALADVSERCWRNVETADATIRTRIERTIQADGSRLAQLLENLVRNAIEHGGEDVTVTIGELGDGFYVEDDGLGIPEDERGSVFEVGHSTARGDGGLGLSIVKQVADAHGWTVQVTDGTEGGARFEITGVEFVG